MTPLDAALRYARSGHPVVPLAPGEKIPLAELAPHGLKDATTDPETLRAWWATHPDAGVAIRCDGLLVLDVDPGGDSSLRTLEAEHEPLPATREQRTPRGGRHLLYRLPLGVEIGNATRGIGRPAGLDVRAGEKGYIACAPSRNGSAAYRWANSRPIADAPAWLVDALVRPQRDESRTWPVGFAGEHTRYGVAALEAEIAAVRKAPEGQRNSRLNESAFALGQLESGGELAPGDAEAALVSAVMEAGLPEHEARRTVRSGLEAGRSAPRSASNTAGTNRNEPPAAAIAKDGEDGQPTLDEALRDPLSFEEYIAPYATIVDESTEVARSPNVRFVALHEYLATPKGSTEALLGDADAFEVLLPAGGLLLMYGDKGASKTTTCLDLVAHLASGTDWHGKTVGRPVRVALIENEGPAEQWRQKLARKLETWDGAPWEENVVVLEEPHGGFDFRLAEHRQALRDLRRDGVELVVADPTKWLGFEGGGTPDEVRAFVSLLRDCGLHSGDAELALSFQLLHHENKSGDVSGAWGADPDTLVHVELDGRERTKLTWEKCRWALAQHGRVEVYKWVTESAGLERIELSDGPQTSDEELDELVLAWLLERSEKHSTTAVRTAMPVRAERVDEALERLKARGDCLDLDKKSSPHEGRPRTPRYWVASAHADLEVVPRTGTTLDDITSHSPQAVRSRPVVPSIEGTTTGRDDYEDEPGDVLAPHVAGSPHSLPPESGVGVSEVPRASDVDLEDLVERALP